jgi:REP element-mobilizing transposase RayT
MSRKLRFIPPQGALVEVTCRTLQSRLLLCPKGHLNSIVIGILARAARLYEVEVCVCAFLSNHYHLLVWVRDAQQLSKFMSYLNSNLAREAGRIHDWKEKFWSRRYEAIVVSEEESAQVGRLRYIVSHGSKEGLVERPQDWPGVHCVDVLRTGDALAGLWFDRTREGQARRRGGDSGPLRFAEPETLELAPLPCWSALPAEVYRGRMVELVAEIEAEAAALREETGVQPPGPETVRAQNPHARPMRTKKRPAPRFHAASRAARDELKQAYGSFVRAFREAAERLRAGDGSARFPAGSFPPGLPFVAA